MSSPDGSDAAGEHLDGPAVTHLDTTAYRLHAFTVRLEDSSDRLAGDRAWHYCRPRLSVYLTAMEKPRCPG